MGQRQGRIDHVFSSTCPTETGFDWFGKNHQRVLFFIFRNIKTDAIVVRNFDELDAMKDQVKGKIVVYNQEWKNYGQSVEYRVFGAQRAAKYGAVAALVRSVASFSIYSVHAGVQFDGPIPIAAISV